MSTIDDAPGNSDPQRYISAYRSCVPHGHDRFILELPEGEPEVVGAELGHLLMQCREFRRLDEHAARLATSIDAQPLRARLRRQLAELVQGGLLLSEDECLSQHDRCVPGAAQAHTIESLGVMTRDRPESLRRGLDSLAQMLMRSGRRLRLVVADDSTAEPARQRNREALAAVAARLGAEADYVGPDEKARLIDQLAARSGVARPTVEFAVRGPVGFDMTAGANRNNLLLATAGEMTFQVDDDIHWRISPAPGRIAGLRCLSGLDPTEMQFFPDRATALAAAPAEELDGLAMHERFLGRTLGGCIAGARDPDRPIVEGALDPMFLLHLLRGSGRAIATSFGIVGDSGSTSPHQLLVLQGASWSNLLDRYDDAVRTREVARAARQTTLIRRGLFMAGAVGLDNRVILPPFFPAGRNEDGIFGIVLPTVSPESYFCHLPAVIAHEPESSRVFDPAAVWTQAGSLRLAELVMLTLQSWRPFPAPGGPRARLVALGLHLEEVGKMAIHDFVDFQRLEAWRRLDHLRRGLQDRLRAAGKLPPSVEDAMTRHLKALEARAGSDQLLWPNDLAGDGVTEDRLGRVQALMAEFGRLLQAWPSLIDAAEDIRDESR